MDKPIIGIIGAGKLGMTLAKLAVDSGYQVNIANSKGPASLKLTVSVLASGAHPQWLNDLIEQSDILILAIPLSKYHQIPPEALADKLVIDAMNYWWEVDGLESDYYDDKHTSSQVVQKYFNHSTVIKAFNHMGYHDLANMTGLNRVIVYAGSDQKALSEVEQLIQGFGFVPFYIGNLDQTSILQPHGALFGVNEDLAGIKKIIADVS